MINGFHLRHALRTRPACFAFKFLFICVIRVICGFNFGSRAKTFLHCGAGRLRWPASEASLPDELPGCSALGRSETMGRERHAESGLNRSGYRLFHTQLPSWGRFVPRCCQRPATGVYPDLRCLISQRSTLNPQQNATAQCPASNTANACIRREFKLSR